MSSNKFHLKDFKFQYMNDKDDEINALVNSIIDKNLRRRINFVPAKYKYTQNLSQNFIFEEITDHYSICYGSRSLGIGGKRNTLYDTIKINQIKNWNDLVLPVNVFKDNFNRGFAISVLYCLSSCPVFRQFRHEHVRMCKRVGCVLCKIYDFYEKTKVHDFPLALRVFNRNYKDGMLGDSSEFFNSLLEVLQDEELSGVRAFDGTDVYTTAIGQMFRIKLNYKILCKNCGRIKYIEDTFWTYCSKGDIKKELSNNQIDTDLVCDACSEPVVMTQEFVSLPIVFTIQIPHWNEKGEYRKRNFNFNKYSNLTINSTVYKLVGFTAYDGFSEKNGKFTSVFKNSTDSWNHQSNNQIQIISKENVSTFMPQLLFFSVDEPSDKPEVATIERILPISENDDEDDQVFDNRKQVEEIEERRLNALRDSILKQLDRSKPKEELTNEQTDNIQNEPIQIIDGTSIKRKRRTEPVQVQKNTVPLDILLSRNAHSVKKWTDGPETREINEIIEEMPDEWDTQLDKGHVRKLKKPKERPKENPFDSYVPSRRPGDIGYRRENKRKQYKANHDKKKSNKN